MKFTDLFVKRPVLSIVVSLVILIAGLQSIRALSVRQYPRSDIAVVTVSTAYVGANADLVRGFITTPLERVIASADGIDYMESSSAQGLSTITVHLQLNYDTNAALTQVQAKVAQVRNDLHQVIEKFLGIETGFFGELGAQPFFRNLQSQVGHQASLKWYSLRGFSTRIRRRMVGSLWATG